MPKGRKHRPEREDTASCGVLSRIVAPVHRPAPPPRRTGSRSRSGCGRAGFPARTRPQGRRTVGPRRVPPADVEQDQRDRRTGVSYPVGGQAVGVAPVPAVPSWPRSDAGAVLPGTGAVRLRLRQHRAVAPLVHQVGHRHLAPAVVPRAVYGVEQARGSGDAALPVEAGERNRPVPTRVHTGTLVRASASTVQHPEIPRLIGPSARPRGGKTRTKPPSTRPARTAQSTICCLVLNPSSSGRPTRR